MSILNGVYAQDGSLNVHVVPGTSFTGLYGADGGINIVHDTTFVGAYHPCGALRYTKQTTDQTNLRSPDGSLNVSASPYKTNTQKVTVLSGVL